MMFILIVLFTFLPASASTEQLPGKELAKIRGGALTIHCTGGAVCEGEIGGSMICHLRDCTISL